MKHVFLVLLYLPKKVDGTCIDHLLTAYLFALISSLNSFIGIIKFNKWVDHIPRNS